MQLVEDLGGMDVIEEMVVRMDEKEYLFGMICRQSKSKGKASDRFYDVQWEVTTLKEAVVELRVIIPAIELAGKITKQIERESRTKKSQYRPTALFGPSVARSLMMVEEGEDGEPDESESEEDERNEEETFYWRYRDGWSTEMDQFIANFEENDDADDSDSTSDEEFPTYRWRADDPLNAPSERSNYGTSKVNQIWQTALTHPCRHFSHLFLSRYSTHLFSIRTFTQHR